MDDKLPYTHIEELNKVVTEIMDDWYKLIDKAKASGLDIRLYPFSDTLELYFNDDYPHTILVDKDLSTRREDPREHDRKST